jgi:hypothetical protein
LRIKFNRYERFFQIYVCLDAGFFVDVNPFILFAVRICDGFGFPDKAKGTRYSPKFRIANKIGLCN